MKKPLAWAVTLATVAACAFGAALPAAAADDTTTTTAAASNAFGLDTSSLDPRQKELVDKILGSLPADYQERVQAAVAEFGAGDTQWADIRDNAINPGEHQCQNTALSAYASNLLKGVDPLILTVFNIMGVWDIAAFDAMLRDGDPRSDSFGVHGEYTNELTHEGRDLKKFWDIDSDGIRITPMHSFEVLNSPERMAHVFQTWVPIGTEEGKLPEARWIIELIHSVPAFQDGANPIFTFNALAYSEKSDPHPAGISDHIVVGDGILQGMETVGLGDTAPRAILAHEFSHHVQYQDNLFDNTTLTGPEATRRTELMADAFGTYFLTHSRGEALNAKRLLDSEKSYYAVGDCRFKSSGHHGTPNQRLAASTWGASVADDAADQGHILPSMQLDELFEAKLADFVKPDATD
ncbi:hypothetical protein [Streptomyces sp. NPDC059349]|uniref:hypothetical protein n=1 Tax=Streptomyces sp. NPDC059349 TaxID=3346808 RepID=UPI0036C80C6B